jgi:ankyrin repeat protein
MFEKIIKYYSDANIVDNGGYTPLHWACQEGHLNIIKKLVDKGALVNVLDQGGFTPLRLAVGSGNTRVFNFLLKYKAVVGDFSFNTLLHNAAAWNRVAIAKKIIQRKCDFNAMDEYGNTPLHYAHMYKHSKMEKILLANNADITIKNKYGMLPLEIELGLYERAVEED